MTFVFTAIDYENGELLLIRLRFMTDNAYTVHVVWHQYISNVVYCFYHCFSEQMHGSAKRQKVKKINGYTSSIFLPKGVNIPLHYSLLPPHLKSFSFYILNFLHMHICNAIYTSTTHSIFPVWHFTEHRVESKNQLHDCQAPCHGIVLSTYNLHHARVHAQLCYTPVKD